MRKFTLIVFASAVILGITYRMISTSDEVTLIIPDQKDMEIDSLREELQYYKNREKMFLDKNSILYNKVTELERNVTKTPETVYIKTTKNEKNPLISTTESEYFNDLLSRRYQDKP